MTAFAEESQRHPNAVQDWALHHAPDRKRNDKLDNKYHGISPFEPNFVLDRRPDNSRAAVANTANGTRNRKHAIRKIVLCSQLEHICNVKTEENAKEEHEADLVKLNLCKSLFEPDEVSVRIYFKV